MTLPLGGWELAACAPAAVDSPGALKSAQLEWVRCESPMTAAAALRAAGQWSLDGPARRFDADDWWYRCRFTAKQSRASDEQWLCFDGLATIADVWLNGELLLSAQGMFTAHECRVDHRLRAENELVLRFHSLDAALKTKRPRPRWRVPMLEEQQLRWFRTTLLGRTPGWSPPAPPVGPWRPIRLETRSEIAVEHVHLQAHGDGALDVGLALRGLGGATVRAATLVVRREAAAHRFPLPIDAHGSLRRHRVTVPTVERWWPHTHGEPALYTVQVELEISGGATHRLDLGRVGFRTVQVLTEGGDFQVVVNGVPVFCRGACWTPLDAISLDATDAELDRAFDQLVDAGLNMVRVGGTMVYETDAFLDRCDARGVLLWQDLMFANMDYPEGDASFDAAVTTEIRQQLRRLQGRPAVAVVCGNSEGEQQAAMWGAGRERWSPALFHALVPSLVAEELDGVAYWPSSAHGGDFPHQGNVGTTSYFGVGAYRRPLEDARRAEPRFATECLAFANVPDESGLAQIPGWPAVRVQQGAWLERAPRDRGASWDFDDIRDHYFALLFGTDPIALRSANQARYLELSRIVPGEVMARTIGEWRRARSVTRGALIWFLRDLWPGAGWGIIAADGTPKAAWHQLRRACAPLALHISDEGGNGLAVHVANDTADDVTGSIELTLWRDGAVRVGHGTIPVHVPARAALEVNAAAAFDAFHDLSYAYRFGPPPHQLVQARLVDADGRERSRAFHFIDALPMALEDDLGVSAELEHGADGTWLLRLSAKKLAFSLHTQIPGYLAEDEHFHLAPGERRSLRLIPTSAESVSRAPQGAVRALNSSAIFAVRPAE